MFRFSLAFRVFVKCQTLSKICGVIIGIAKKLKLRLYLLNPKYYQNENRSNTSVLYDTFLTRFWLNAGVYNLVPGPFMILLKWQVSEIWRSLIADIYHF